MAKLTIRNTTNESFFLPDLRVSLGPGGSAQIERHLPELEEMPVFMQLFELGDLAVDIIAVETWELTWRNWLAREAGPDGAYAMAKASRILHKDTITPTDAEPSPGLGPVPITVGTFVGLHYNNPTDLSYRTMKINSTFIPGGAGPAGDGDNASFHVHWTKAVDTDQSGATVRWRLTYTVSGLNGSGDIAIVAPTGVIEWDDTYDDAGTTTRIPYRTANMPAAGFIPGYYLGVRLEYVPASTTLAGGPVVLSCDLLFRNYINQGA